MQQMGFLTFIAPSNLFMAVSVMNKIVAKMGGTGKISHIGGQPGHTGAQARGQGFLNVLANYPDIADRRRPTRQLGCGDGGFADRKRPQSQSVT